MRTTTSGVADPPAILQWLLRRLPEAERLRYLSERRELFEARRARLGAERAKRRMAREDRWACVHLIALLLRFRPLADTRRHLAAGSSFTGRNGSMKLASSLRFGLRRLVAAPASTATIVLTVALGLGGTTAAFSLAHGVLIQPLPYDDAGALVSLRTGQTDGDETWSFSAVDYLALVDQQTSFESVAAYDPNAVTLQLGSGAERVRTLDVTVSFFPTLRIVPRLGRLFSPEDDEPGAPGVVILSDAFWRDRLGSDRAVIGRPLTIGGESFTVVGVLPPTAGPIENEIPFFRNLRLAPPSRKGPFFLYAVGRLRDGVTLESAGVEARAINDRIFSVWQDSWPDAESTWIVRSLKDWIVGDAGGSVVIALGAVAFLLLIACTNAASLLVARGLRQRPEIAVRAALGASRGRLLRELLAEGAVLASVGAALALGVALAGIRLARLVGQGFIPRVQEIGLNGPVLGFFAIVTLGSFTLFALLPALQTSAGSLTTELAGAGRGRSATLRTNRLRRGLVAAEFAVTTPLLVGSALLLASMSNLVRVDPGYDPDGLLTAFVSIPSEAYPDGASMRAFWNDLTERIAGLPGVSSVGISDGRPPDEPGFGNNFVLEDRPVRPDESQPSVPWVIASPGYFEAVGVPLLEGRMFDAETDGAVALVDRAWAERFYPGESAVGRRFRHGGCTRPDCDPWEVIGVVDDVRYTGIADAGAGTMYLNREQYSSTDVYLVVRTTAEDPLSLLPAIRDLVRRAEPAAPLSRIATGRELIRDSLQEPRYLTLLVGGFAAVALLLSLIGVYGVMAYFVQEQRRGIGIRLALGGTSRTIVGYVLANGLRVVTAGTAAGLFVGLVMTRFLSSLLYDIGATDPLAFAGVTAGLLVLAIAACYWPAHRAAAIDPASLLRDE